MQRTRFGPSAAACSAVLISLGSVTGGSNFMGVEVMPHGRAGVVSNTALRKGGPLGSAAIIAFTSCGRSSAMTQPNEPDCEWVRTIAGPILSRSAAVACLSIGSLTVGDAMYCTWDA